MIKNLAKLVLDNGGTISPSIIPGEYIDGTFYADELQTKCASRYEGDLRNEANYKLEELDT